MPECLIVSLNSSIAILLYALQTILTIMRQGFALQCFHISGITITGLETPLIVGQSATISCMTNIAVNFIEWRNESSQLIMSDAGDLMELQYTIDLVTDDLQGQEFTCIAIAADTTTYNETVIIQVQGITIIL